MFRWRFVKSERQAQERARSKLKTDPEARAQARTGKALIASELLSGGDASAASDAGASGEGGVGAGTRVGSGGADSHVGGVPPQGPVGLLELESPLSVTDHMRLLGTHTPTPGQLSSCHSLICQSLMSGLASGSASFGSQNECNSLLSALPSGSLSFELMDGISPGLASSSTVFTKSAITPGNKTS